MFGNDIDLLRRCSIEQVVLLCRLLLLTYHIGLFVTLLLGQIGVQGRKQGYW